FFDSVTMFSRAPVYWLLGAGAVLLAAGLVSFAARSAGKEVWVSWICFHAGLLLFLSGIYWIWVLNALAEARPYSIEKRNFR
ncbi:MAG TPA: hypothetical protein VGR89_00885, partial [Puia sp.]|nr:hypothetical protein [Puia sp.]